MELRWPICLVLAGCFLSGCRESASSPPSPVAGPKTNPVPNAVHMNQAQPKLRTLKLWLGPREINAEVAIDEKEIATGMMFRKQIGDNEGMLFVFTRPHRAQFYMKNTTVPLSCAYMDIDGVILEIHDLHPLDEKPVVAASNSILFVLETQQGWFARNNIGIGAVVRAEQGSLRQVLFKRERGG